MSRQAELEARRRALLARCEEQRAELAYRFEQLRPMTRLGSWAMRAPAIAANHPLGWLAALIGLVGLLRPKRALSWLTLATGALSILSRAAVLLKVFATIRSLRKGFR